MNNYGAVIRIRVTGTCPGFFIGDQGLRAESVGVVLVEGQQPPHQLGVWRNTVSSHSGVWGRAPTAQRFSTIFGTQDGLFLILLIVDYHPAIGRQYRAPPPLDTLL